MDSERAKLQERLVSQLHLAEAEGQQLKEYVFRPTNRRGDALVSELVDLVVLSATFEELTVFADLLVVSEGGHVTMTIKLG